MISVSQRVNNSNKCVVTFDFTPDDVRCQRGSFTAVHKAGGSRNRHNIWEGVECIEAKVKIGNGGWHTFSLPSNHILSFEVSDNNVKVEAKGVYRLKTMGYYFENPSYPFFWYGNVDGKNHHSYNRGSFKGAALPPVTEFYSVHAVVPTSWTHIATDWSDWAYIDATKNHNVTQWAIEDGKYAQRVGSVTASTSNGWKSETYKTQTWRKSCMFTFTKEYTSSTTTSGIAVNPGTPSITVTPAKGDNGRIDVTYNANNSGNGKIHVEAMCSGVVKTVMDYNSSPDFWNGRGYTLWPDFNTLYGEAFRANDIQYRVKAKNVHGYESGWGLWTGTHRYNGRPTVPTGLRVTNPDSIYNKVELAWNSSSDPDKDNLVYDIWIRAISPGGTTIVDDFATRGHYGTTYSYDISHMPDGTRFAANVRASDNLITSAFMSSPLEFEKGSKPKSIPSLMLPMVRNNDLYSKRPRFVFNGYDGESECVVVLNGTERFSNKYHSDLFVIENSRFIFKPNRDLTNNNIQISAYLRNKFGDGPSSEIYGFSIKSATENIVEHQIINHLRIREVQNIIINMGKAFNMTFNIEQATANEYYKASFYNDCYDAIDSVNKLLNDSVSNNTFDYTLTSKKVVPGDINDDLIWEQLINDITNM